MTATSEQREEMLKKMQEVSHRFYGSAIAIGCHPFIEFCGLMNEYIKVCEAAQKEGIDFTEANGHTGVALPLRTYHVEYLGEKLHCIYGPALRDPALRSAFVDAACGREEQLDMSDATIAAMLHPADASIAAIAEKPDWVGAARSLSEHLRSARWGSDLAAVGVGANGLVVYLKRRGRLRVPADWDNIVVEATVVGAIRPLGTSR